ncbi:MAG: FkbM family methyltransferase [Chitinophagaceae bacterium]|nr:MAG: FkbM family methyltransferase [Chitinophagaceae bacterium]
MGRFFNRVEVYSLYFFEYLRFGEFRSLRDAFVYMLSGQSNAKADVVKSGMGTFETRAGSLDFQYVNYAYELHLKRFIEKEQFDTFLDIGACLGEYSVWLGKKGKRCIAFEPVSHSYKMIQRNIRLNGVENNVTACNYGLGSKHSTEYFELNTVNPGANKRVDGPGSNTERFEINALDSKLGELNLKPSDKILIKIDVEGMELEMINGARNFLTTYDNIVLIIEEKFSGESNIRNGLSQIAKFEFGKIDEHNIYARKVKPAANS